MSVSMKYANLLLECKKTKMFVGLSNFAKLDIFQVSHIRNQLLKKQLFVNLFTKLVRSVQHNFLRMLRLRLLFFMTQLNDTYHIDTQHNTFWCHFVKHTF